MSNAELKRAQQYIPGGVNSPVRAFRGVGGDPRFVAKGEGAYLFDTAGKRYIDYVQCWGALIAGHCFPPITNSVAAALKSGTGFGAPTVQEVDLAEEIVKLVPGAEMVRLVNSGTEATMTAARLARAFTGREIIVKFNGCYHGHADTFLVAAGSGVATLGIAGSPGVPMQIAELTVSIEFNDLELFAETLQRISPQRVAAVIVEPVPGNMGLILPEAGYLRGIQRICREHGILFIADEVMSGFRVALNGAAGRFDLQPDLITLGKIIGGGLPLAAVTGRRELMEMLAPVGPVYQAGTLSGNPLAVAAGLAALKYLQAEDPYPRLDELSARLMAGLAAAAKKAAIPFSALHCGGMFGFFFRENAPRNFAEVKSSDVELFKKFFHGMLEEGVYFAPSAFEAGFVSTAHGDEQIDYTVEKAALIFEQLAVRNNF